MYVCVCEFKEWQLRMGKRQMGNILLTILAFSYFQMPLLSMGTVSVIQEDGVIIYTLHCNITKRLTLSQNKA